MRGIEGHYSAICEKGGCRYTLSRHSPNPQIGYKKKKAQLRMDKGKSECVYCRYCYGASFSSDHELVQHERDEHGGTEEDKESTAGASRKKGQAAHRSPGEARRLHSIHTRAGA